MKPLTILAIETSCDETAIAILKSNKKGKARIVSNIVSSQVKKHAPYGGVVPSLAKREHQKNLIPILETALKEAGFCCFVSNKKKKDFTSSASFSKEKKVRQILKRDGVLGDLAVEFLRKCPKPKVDLIAVTYGPGLEPALWPGINLARALSFFWEIEIEKTNHLEAHILVNYLDKEKKLLRSNFPCVCLLVSGGHTQLVLMKEMGKYKIIGETRDDAAGECFDKAARIIGLKYPGGPEISRQAEKWQSQFVTPAKSRLRLGGAGVQSIVENRTSPGCLDACFRRHDNKKINLPRPMIHSKDFDFSFSGLKTAVLYLVEKIKKERKNSPLVEGWPRLGGDGVFPPLLIQELSYQIQEAITDVLASKTIKAGEKYKAKKIILAGGVAANEKLREKLRREVEEKLPRAEFLTPELRYSTDNGAMIAMAAYLRRKYKMPQKASWRLLRARPNLRLGNLT